MHRSVITTELLLIKRACAENLVRTISTKGPAQGNDSCVWRADCDYVERYDYVEATLNCTSRKKEINVNI